MFSVLMKRRKPHAVIANQKYVSDAGRDLVCCDSVIVWPFTSKDIDTGWDIKIPDGMWGTIKTRSSTFSRLRLMVLEGVIDPGYTGKLSTVVYNSTFWPKIIKRGDRLAQLMLIDKRPIRFDVVDVMPETDRGTNGFGHTGR